MRIGVDVDGVLADFDTDYIERMISVTGRDLFPPRPFEILTLGYPESYGYTADEVSKVWERIKSSPIFWVHLPPYKETLKAITTLRLREQQGTDELYFITARPGIYTKYQTERWLTKNSGNPWWHPTVLISSDKGRIARALNLERYIDDKIENVQAVAPHLFTNRTYLMDRPWNRNFDERLAGITRATTVEEMLR